MKIATSALPIQGLPLAWLFLGLFALLVSAIFAVILVVLRTPYLSQWLGQGLPFRTALVLHVDLAVAVWFLAVAGLFWSLIRRESLWGWLAWGLSSAGVVAMLASPMAETGVAVINNYLPVVNSPLFLGGLALFAIGILGSATLALLPTPAETSPALHWAARGAALLTLLATATTLHAWFTLPQGLPMEAHRFEILFWGGGHLLQFVHTLLMLAAWWVMLAPAPPREHWMKGAVLLALLPPLFTVPLWWPHPPESLVYRSYFTDIMSYASWLPLLAMVPVLLPTWRAPRRGGYFSGLVTLSALLFLLGIGIGVAIRGDNLMVTAHYHGTVGAITLAFMGLASHQLDADRGRVGTWLYGGGLLLLIAGLCWAGLEGAPRKAMFNPSATSGLLPPILVGLGGLAALTGLFLFILPTLRTLLQRLWSPGASPVLLSLLAIGASGLLMQWMQLPPQAAPPPPPPRIVAEDPELRLRFQQGAMMLHAGEYEHAVVAFHEVLEKAPQLPEAHVNMGYALLGLARFAAARDFFLAAIDLRPVQANSYFGLGEAYEGLAELEEALGAMRTFIHMTHDKDPFLPRARAAIWEWENRLGRIPANKAEK